MIHRGSAHYRLSLAGGGTDLGEGEGLCITLSLPWRCHVTREDVWRKAPMTSHVRDDDWSGEGLLWTSRHPILKHLTNVEPQHVFIVTHELPTRVGLGSSAALALAATAHDRGFNITEALELDAKATGAGWQDVHACAYNGCNAISRESVAWLGVDAQEKLWYPHLLLFSTGGTHTEARNASELDPLVRQLALKEAHTLRDEPTLETLAWCMKRQWERKMDHVPESVIQAIQSSAKSGALAAKSTGSRGAGFGVVLTKDRERTRDALVECGARVWMP